MWGNMVVRFAEKYQGKEPNLKVIHIRETINEARVNRLIIR
jgi:hypothetical protein